MRKIHPNLRLWGLTLLCLFAAAMYLNAQCSCKSAPVNLDFNSSGVRVVTLADVVVNPMSCSGTLTLSIGNQPISGNIITCSLGNQALTATVTNGSSSCSTTVFVNDVTPPIIIANDVTVACNNIVNSSISATASDACDGNITQIPHSDIILNGTCADPFMSKTTRTWTASDSKGNSTTKIQIITVARPDLTKVTFPSNTPTFSCSLGLDPNNVAFLGQPLYLGQPLANSITCGIAVSKQDMTFTYCQKGYKIIRTWTVTDFMCMNSMISSMQEIKVMDSTAPFLKVPKDSTYSTDAKTCTATVTLPKANATDDCSAVSIEAFSSFGVGYGPFKNITTGSYTVTYKATDECGNVATSNMTVTVKDLIKPTPICYNGLSASLTAMNGGMVTIDAKTFNAGSYDNCTVKTELDFKLKAVSQPDLPAKEVNFNCSDLGLQEVQLWVTDKAGNSDFCTTYIDIQDNNQLCTTGSKVTFAGEVKKPNGEKVQDVTLKITGFTPLKPIFTGINGFFGVNGLPTGKNYSFQPMKDTMPTNGISTLDILLIQKHVLGTKGLTSPYQFIAADVDKNGKVSTGDIVALRKLILGVNKNFANNKSWRFVESTYKFKDTINPLNDIFPELKQYTNLKSSTKVDFTAVKVGDISGDAKANNVGSSSTRNENKPLILNVKDDVVETGNTLNVKIDATNFDEINGLQMKLAFDANAIELQEIQNGTLDDLTEQHFATQNAKLGEISLSWTTNEEKAKRFKAETVFTMVFKAKQNGRLSDWLHLEKNSDLQAEAYNIEENVLPIVLNFEGEKTSNEFVVLQNQPNPFDASTEIKFRLPSAEKVSLQIFDLNGRLLQSKNESFPQGWNSLKIQKEDLPNSGVYYYRLATSNASFTRKMIMID